MAIRYGSSYTFNNAVTFETATTGLDSTHLAVVFVDDGNADKGTGIIGVVSNGNQIAYGSEYLFNNGDTNYPSAATIDATTFLVAYTDNSGAANIGTVKIGTVASGNQITFGTDYVFNNAVTNYTKVAVLDSTHFVVAYYDNTSAEGLCIIGEISAGTISYGTPARFKAGAVSDMSMVSLDSTSFIVTFRDANNSEFGTAVIGEVTSGNVIAYGSDYVFNSDATYHTSVTKVDSSHVIISFSDFNSGERGMSIAGVVSSGNVLTYGNAVVFDSLASYYTSSVRIDSTRFAVIFQENGGSNEGYAIVGKLSGSPLVDITFEPYPYVFSPGVAYLSGVEIGTNGVAMAFADIANSNIGVAVIGDVLANTNIKTVDDLLNRSIGVVNNLEMSKIVDINSLM